PRDGARTDRVPPFLTPRTERRRTRRKSVDQYYLAYAKRMATQSGRRAKNRFPPSRAEPTRALPAGPAERTSRERIPSVGRGRIARGHGWGGGATLRRGRGHLRAALGQACPE